MQIISLQRFTEIVQAGSLYQAAKNSRVSVQSYAKTLNSLEKELGTTLAKRSRAGIQLTVSGSLLYQFALKATSEFNVLKMAIGNLPSEGSDPEAQITIYATQYLIRLLSFFVGDYNLLFRFRWRQESFEKLILRLTSEHPGSMFTAEMFSDEAFRLIEKNGIIAVPYCRTVLGLVVRADSPIARQQSIDCHLVADMPLCLHSQKERYAHRRLVFGNMLPSNVVIESESIKLLSKFVLESPEHGCLSDSYMFHCLKKARTDARGLCFVPFNQREASAYLCLLHQKEGPSSTLTEHFTNLFKELAATSYSDYAKVYPLNL